MTRIIRLGERRSSAIRAYSTLAAIALVIFAPMYIPNLVGVWNEYVEPSTTEQIWELNRTTLRPLTAYDNHSIESQNYTIEVDEGDRPSGFTNCMAWNSSIIWGMTADAKSTWHDTGQTIHYLAWTIVPPYYPPYELDGRLITTFNYDDLVDSARVPYFPSWYYDGDLEVANKVYEYSSNFVVFGTTLSRAIISDYKQVTGSLSIQLIPEPGYGGISGATAVNLDHIHISITEDTAAGPSLYDWPTCISETASTNSLQYNFTISDLLLYGTSDDSYLTFEIQTKPWHLYTDFNNTFSFPIPFSLSINFTAWAMIGPLVLDYLTFTDSSIMLSGFGFFIACGYIIWNIPESRTYFYNRKIVKVVGTQTDINRYAQRKLGGP
jgi:hypothetical protein